MALTKVKEGVIDLDQLDARYVLQGDAGSGTDLEVQDEGVTIVTAASTLDFIGTGVTAVDSGGGKVSVTVSAGPQSVDSVFGRTGTVVAASGDYTSGQITDGGGKVQMTDAERTKLAGIETAADVTDATNVNAAGAVMNSDTAVTAMAFVIDDDSMATASATTLSTSESIKAYVDAQAIPDGNKGDITVSGGGATWLTNNNVITYAKMQNTSVGSVLIGRGDSGAGDPQEISLGTNITMSGTTLNVSTGTATLGDGDYGDITVSASGTVMTIDNDVVSNAKAADMAQDRIKGRVSAGSGDPEDLTAAQVQTIIGFIDWTAASANFSTTGTLAAGTTTINHAGGNGTFGVTINATADSGDFLNLTNDLTYPAIQARQNADGSGSLEVYPGGNGSTAHHVFGGTSSTGIGVVNGQISDQIGSAAFSVIGDLGVSGLVDGRDIAADGIVLDNVFTDIVFEHTGFADATNPPSFAYVNGIPYQQYAEGDIVRWPFTVPNGYSTSDTWTLHLSLAAETATTGNVIFEAALFALSDGDSAAYDTFSFDTANASAATAVAATVKYPFGMTITLTNKDSVAEGDTVLLQLERAASTATGDITVLRAVIRRS